jgi:hypothetical protein
MRNLTATLCLTLAVLLGSVGVSESQDLQKGFDAYNRGDYATALREWTPLAEQGDADAQYNLGQMYRRGQGVPQDYKTAMKWYTLAAEQGNALAQNNVGVAYSWGDGVQQDHVEAVRWYRLAAEQGHAGAQNSLGAKYYNGVGVLEDYVYAHMWWNIAASSGSQKASENRDMVAERMTPPQLEKAQDLARECVAKNYKNC